MTYFIADAVVDDGAGTIAGGFVCCLMIMPFLFIISFLLGSPRILGRPSSEEVAEARALRRDRMHYLEPMARNGDLIAYEEWKQLAEDDD